MCKTDRLGGGVGGRVQTFFLDSSEEEKSQRKEEISFSFLPTFFLVGFRRKMARKGIMVEYKILQSNSVITNSVITNSVITSSVITNSVITSSVITNSVVNEHSVDTNKF
jgi:hypothetical protein